MTTPDIPAPPPGLGVAGRRLWLAIVDDFELSEHESGLLLEACRTVDSLEQLQAVVDAEGVVVESPHGRKCNPALVEARAQRAVLAKLMASLRLPAGVEGKARARRERWPNSVTGLAV